MSSEKVIPSVVRPGGSASGPPGWEERRQASVIAHHHHESDDAGATAADEAGTKGDKRASHGSGIEGVKDALHKVGEKLALLPPKNAEAGTATQNASTNPE